MGVAVIGAQAVVVLLVGSADATVGAVVAGVFSLLNTVLVFALPRVLRRRRERQRGGDEDG